MSLDPQMKCDENSIITLTIEGLVTSVVSNCGIFFVGSLNVLLMVIGNNYVPMVYVINEYTMYPDSFKYTQDDRSRNKDLSNDSVYTKFT